MISLILTISMAVARMPAPTPAPTETHWDVNLYVNKSLGLDETLKTSTFQKKSAETEYETASDVFQNTLELRPNYFKRALTLEPAIFPDIEDGRKGITGTMNQILPTGSILGIQGTRFFEKGNPNINGLNSDYKIFFEQALWRNSFGSLYRRRMESSSAKVEQMDFTEQKTLLDSCIVSLELYINAFLGQEELAISQQVFLDAEKAMKIAESGQAQGLLRRIDFLNAKSDFLKIKNDLLRAQSNFEQRMSAMKVKVSEDLSSIIKLKEPETFFNQIEKPTQLDLPQVLAYRAALAKIESARANYQAIDNQTRSQVDLGVSAGQTRSVSQATPTTFGEAQQQTFELYVKLQLPLINKTRTAQVDNSFYGFQMAEIEKSFLERQLRQQFNQFAIDEKITRDQIKVSLDNQKVKRLQLQEAQRLLRIGKIEFEQYVRYRDSYFAEKTTEIRFKSLLWQSIAKLAQFNNNLAQHCRKI